MTYYRRVPIVDGETDEPVQFVGVHPIRWDAMVGGYHEPQAAFIECDDPVLDAAPALLAALDDLLLYVEGLWQERRDIGLPEDHPDFVPEPILNARKIRAKAKGESDG